MAKSGTQLGPVDMSSDVPLVEASIGQGWYSGLVDLSSNVPLVVASTGQK